MEKEKANQKINQKEKRKTCCICQKEFTEYGNDPWPVKEEGRCCDYCDATEVTVKRLELMGYSTKGAKEFGEWFYKNIKSMTQEQLESFPRATNKQENKHE